MLEKRIALIDYQMDELKDKREIMVHELYELQQDLQKDGAGVPK
jgi:chaperonin cofactor prefoldin